MVFFSEGETICIDEIKGIYRSLDSLEKPVEVHRAQALCYGWIYMEMHELESIDIQMTYGQLDTEEIRRFRETLTREELENWYQNLLIRTINGYPISWHGENREMSP